MKINLLSGFDIIWCSPEARGRNTARTATRKQSSRLNCAMFRLSVSRYAVTQDVFRFLTILVKGQGPSSHKHAYSEFNLTTLYFAREEEVNS